MMSEEQALIQAIFEKPDDHTIRLIYADWLEERGDLRCEFLRLQSELAQMSPDDPRRKEKEVREQELLEKHAAKWLELRLKEYLGTTAADLPDIRQVVTERAILPLACDRAAASP